MSKGHRIEEVLELPSVPEDKVEAYEKLRRLFFFLRSLRPGMTLTRPVSLSQ